MQHQGAECSIFPPFSAQSPLGINKVYLLEVALGIDPAGVSAHGTMDPHWPF